jgi:hypothetical protein
MTTHGNGDEDSARTAHEDHAQEMEAVAYGKEN